MKPRSGWSILFLLPQVTQPLWAQNSISPTGDWKPARVALSQTLYIQYLHPSWNKNPQAPDAGVLLLRDPVSQQVFSIELRETQNNSGQFSGQFKLDANSKIRESSLEVYLPPQVLPEPHKVKLANLIQDGIVLRKPYFFRIDQKQQRMDIFDTKDQALEAYRYFVRSGQSAQVVNPNLLETQARAAMEAKALEEKKKKEAELAIAEHERLLAAQIKERADAEKKRSEAERRERQAQARQVAQKALNLYEAENYTQAVQLFDQAVELDPSNASFYFQYGISLYRNDQNEKSVAYLNQVNDKGLQTQNSLFLGLNYVRLKDWANGYQAFEKIKADKEYGPTATFYLGIIDFSQENLDAAQKHFETVLDTSSDPKMDQAAENYIEQILSLKRYRELQSKKWTVTGNLGFAYDSNILTVSPDVVATDLAGFRTSYGFNLEYRPLFTEKHEFLGQISFSDMYSLNSSLQGSASFQNVDPQSIGIVLPYRWKGNIAEKPAQLGLTPSYRQTSMNADGEGSRETILRSSGLSSDLTLVHSEKVTGIYGLELRSDDSLTAGAEDDNQDAQFVGLTSTFTYFYDPDQPSRALLLDAGVNSNQALGRNQKYNGLNLGVGLLQPGYFKALWITKLTATQKSFAEHTIGRQDLLLNLTVLAQKQFKNNLQGSGIFTYSKNNSSMSSLSYDQFMLMGQLTWQTSF